MLERPDKEISAVDLLREQAPLGTGPFVPGEKWPEERKEMKKATASWFRRAARKLNAEAEQKEREAVSASEEAKRLRATAKECEAVAKSLGRSNG